MDISSINSSNSATTRGTKIVKSGNDLDKNSFLRILTAELSNQDPSNAKDSTQFVAQMAQFASLEQMTNLNTTMTMSSANSMIGKGVSLRATDLNGEPYTGIVKSVTNSSGSIKLTVEVTENGATEYKQFSYDDVTDIIEVPDYKLDTLNINMAFLTASTLIGKKAEFTDKDESGNKYAGTVKAAYIEGNSIKLTLQLSGSDKTVDLPYTNLIKVSEA